VTGQASRPSGIYWLLVAPALLLVLGLYVWPLLKILALSFTDPVPGLQNYRLLFTSGAIGRILMTTARICGMTSALTLIGGYAIAYALVHAGERQRQWMLFLRAAAVLALGAGARLRLGHAAAPRGGGELRRCSRSAPSTAR